MSLNGKNILLGICGGIAAYKIPGLVRALIKAGASVQVILTKNSEQFIGKATFSTLTKREVLSDLFPLDRKISTEHISASDWASCLLVAPATANCLAKFANGIADDFLSTIYLSLNVPVILAPSMNERMWGHPAVQDNITMLKKRNVVVIEPGEGDLACGTKGKGRLPSEEILLFNIKKALTKQDLKDKRILITCGGTSEALDPVRVITNKSSGRMGIALAVNAMERGAMVTLIHGNITVPVPEFINSTRVESSRDMLLKTTDLFKKNDLLIMAAAVSDFTPEAPSKEKIKKTGKGLEIFLKETPDILKTISKEKGKRKIIGFALESNYNEKKAFDKLKDKKCDLLIYNTQDALSSATTRITIIQAGKTPLQLKDMPKTEAAKTILDHTVNL